MYSRFTGAYDLCTTIPFSSTSNAIIFLLLQLAFADTRWSEALHCVVTVHWNFDWFFNLSHLAASALRISLF
jgi:hypothetical protein